MSAAERPLSDTGTRTASAQGGLRDRPEGKGRFDLLQMRALRRIAIIMEKGAKKYAERNWERGMPLSWFMDSALRHISQHMQGNTDEDHLGQAAWNLLSAIEMEEMISEGLRPAELDDLPKLLKVQDEIEEDPVWSTPGHRIIDVEYEGVAGPLKQCYDHGPECPETARVRRAIAQPLFVKP